MLPGLEIYKKILPCNHQGADGRIFLNVLDVSYQGHSKVLIRTSDSDVVVIAVFFFKLQHNLK